MDKEIRYYNTDFEVRSEDNNNTLIGYAAVFNSESRDLGGFTEVISPGAFSATLQSGYDFKAFLNHNSERTLGRIGNGSLKLIEDEVGLRAEITLPNSQFGRDLAEEVRSGYLNKMSFGFSVKEEDWVTRESDGVLVRILRVVDLFEVSIVSEPAYLDTSIAKRNYEEVVKTDEVDNLDNFKRKLKTLKHKHNL